MEVSDRPMSHRVESRACWQHAGPNDPVNVVVRGELDSAAVGRLSVVLDAIVPRPFVVLDLTEVTFCSSAGWRCVERFLDNAQRRDSIVVVRPSPAIDRLLTILERLAQEDAGEGGVGVRA